jgi:hypothetical protein
MRIPGAFKSHDCNLIAALYWAQEVLLRECLPAANPAELPAVNASLCDIATQNTATPSRFNASYQYSVRKRHKSS